MNSSISNSKLKRAFSTILLFLLALLLADRLLFILISTTESALFTDLTFKAEFKEYMREKRVSTLIMGTSRTYEGIHPRYFQDILKQNAYKEAQPGKGPKYNYYFYRFYREQVGIPDIVIYGIDYFTFNIESRNQLLSRFNYRAKVNYFMPDLLLLKHKKRINEFIDTIVNSLKTTLDKKSNRHTLRDFIKIQNYLGVNPQKNHVISRKPKYFKRFRYHKYPGIEGNFFLSLLRLLEQDNVTVLLVMLPDYSGTNSSNIHKRIFIRDILSLAARFSNIRVYNYNTIRKFPLDRPELFLNGGFGLTNSHLSRKGAYLFNRIFLNDIRHHYDKKRLKPAEADHGDRQNP
jgi:hypothetical protein